MMNSQNPDDSFLFLEAHSPVTDPEPVIAVNLPLGAGLRPRGLSSRRAELHGESDL